MLPGVVLEILPKVVTKCVFVIYIGFQHRAQPGAMFGEFRKLEIPGFTEPYEVDSFAMLRDQRLRIDNGGVQVVTQLFS